MRGAAACVLAICNGFQIACEAGLLPGVLMRNAALHFVCRFQHLWVERADTPFTNAYAQGQAIKVCVAHGEGNYVADEATLGAESRARAWSPSVIAAPTGDWTKRPIPTERRMRSPASIRRTCVCSG